MQHAVGAPLPPSHRPAGQGPGPQDAGWAQSASQPPGPPPHPAPPVPPMPTPPAQPAHPAAPMPPVPVPPVPAPPAPPMAGHPQTGHPTPQPPVEHPGTTGHIQLPPGGPVPLPHPPADPAMADASQAAVAVLLIGPAGAGKTTVARYWADRRRVPTAHISLDDVREWVRSGFANPQSGWNENSEAQYRLARRTCGFAARNFLANGISCILDDAVFPDRPVVGLGGWKRHVGPGLLPVVVLPGLEIVLERNAARSGNRRLSDEEVARIHGRMAGWYGSGLPIIDNSTYDVETTARMLDEVVARSIASPPTF
ncbi:AAA family ATPase [Streptomyces sp. RTd22]|uniref:AAA family ATPase n=1 Tax=Streptomyces sp. RTd22 TaxID=1841249 RepID=UPI0007C4D2B4|nr:AAA family ATPase [Streptomyces sp. RTd22]